MFLYAPFRTRLINSFAALTYLFIGLFVALPARAQSDAAWQRWVSGGVKAANVNLTVTPQDLDVLKKDWGVNAIRAQIFLEDGPLASLRGAGIESNHRLHDRISALLDAANQRGIGVILDLHRAEGSAGAAGQLWKDAEFQDRIVQLWRKIAPAYKGHPALIGYDILNEPTPPDDFVKEFRLIRGSLQDWNVLALRIVKAIRESDTRVPLIVETTDWAKPFRFKQMEKIDDPRIVYSFHMYSPFELTHQGVAQYKRRPDLTYPGSIDGKTIDRDALTAQLSAVAAFAAKNNVPIFVGEFGINMYAPEETRVRYLGDLISIFDTAGWSWAYHAYKIWNGWMPSDRMLALIYASKKK